MTKTLLAVLVALMLLVLAPVVSAHGAPEAREIDERVLADGSSNGDYGASGALDEGGLDVLALDIYEGTLQGTLEPAIVFRFVLQGGDAEVGPHKVQLDFTAGTAHSRSLSTQDLLSYTSSDFDEVRGPFDVGDGHPKAIEAVLGYGDSGLTAGDSLNDITVTTSFGDSDADDMPGSWYFQGVEVPSDPTTEAPPAGTYTLQGPGPFFTVESGTDLLEPGAGTATAQVHVNNTLSTFEQVFMFTVDAPEGIEAELSEQTLTVPPGASSTLNVTVSGFSGGDVKLLAHSDLGVSRQIAWPLAGGAMQGNGADVQTELMGQGESVSYIFDTPAVFEYHCHPHSWMTGTVTILEAENGTGPATHIIRMLEHDPQDPDSYEFSPSELEVRVGDTVVWINEGTQLHNVHGSTGIGGSGHDHGDHDHGDEDTDAGKDAPGLGLAFVLFAFAAIAVAARRD